MQQKIFALLIGIDQYEKFPLQGCVRDMESMASYVESFANSNGKMLSMRKLTNQQATRQNFIDAFSMFAAASGEDICLLYYAGHGSYIPAAPEFWTETDGNNETFVCFDSRLDGGRDLIDKEFAYLLWKTFFQKPTLEVIVITDCCHSGNIVRLDNEESVAVRRATPTDSFVPVEAYYGFEETDNGVKGYVIQEEEGKRKIAIRQIPMIHLAASQDNQTAKEIQVQGQRRGAFTYCLMRILEETGGKASYKSIIDKTAVQLKSLVSDQRPLLNVLGGLPVSSTRKHFLSQQEVKITDKALIYFDGSRAAWHLNRGAIDGLQSKASLQLQDEKITIKEVGLNASVLVPSIIMGNMDKQKLYEVDLSVSDMYTINFFIAANVSDTIRMLLINAIGSQQEQLVEIIDEAQAEYVIEGKDDGYYFSKRGSSEPLLSKRIIKNKADAANFISLAQHIGKWLQILGLTKEDVLKENVQLLVVQAGYGDDPEKIVYDSDHPVPMIELTHEVLHGVTISPFISLRCINRSRKDIWVGAAYLGCDYSIATNAFMEERIPAGKETLLKAFVDEDGTVSERFPIVVNDRMYENGCKSITEYIKAFVCCEKPMLDALEQQGIHSLSSRAIETKYIQARHSYSEWRVVTLRFHVTRK